MGQQHTDARTPAYSTNPVIRPIGTIVNSDTHIHYWCQIYGPQDIANPPAPGDYSFGRFVRVDLPGDSHDTSVRHALIGVLYDTVLENPAFGSLGPRLSADDAQRAVFTPDYLTEQATLVRLLALGTATSAADGSVRYQHGIPPLALALGAVVSPIDDAAVRAFHCFADEGTAAAGPLPGDGAPYLHMGYLPQLIAQPNGLLPQVALRILDQLQTIFPEYTRLLAIVRRNLAWKLAVETAG